MKAPESTVASPCCVQVHVMFVDCRSASQEHGSISARGGLWRTIHCDQILHSSFGLSAERARLEFGQMLRSGVGPPDPPPLFPDSNKISIVVFDFSLCSWRNPQNISGIKKSSRRA